MDLNELIQDGLEIFPLLPDMWMPSSRMGPQH